MNLDQLWGILFSMGKSPSQDMMSQFCDLAKQLVINFNSFSHILEGFDNKNVTPYMHIMVYHVPKLL